MRRFITILPFLFCGFAFAAEPVDFSSQIKPILSDRCFKCHGPDEEARKSGLRLDRKDSLLGLLKDSEDLHAVKPGDPEKSEVYQRIIHTDPDEVMPPPKSKLKVSAKEAALIRDWIQQGAPYEEHWSFVPLRKPEVPSFKDAWIRNEIDPFVLRRLHREKLRPAPEAEKAVLLRRVSFDLTGLPPSPAEMKAFRDDPSPDAYEKAVDRLLASERYGERMAVEWLDVARYADSYGMQVDRDRRVWPWRDWVINAFNQNLPFDDFITWQLAGDLLPAATDEQILATTFSRLHPQKVEGGSVPEEFRVEYVADRTQTFGTAFLGLTLECSRCHDHKYDPITAKDYYSLFAFFNNIDEAGLYSYFTPSIPTPTLFLSDDGTKAKLAELEAKAKAEEAKLASLADDEGFRAWLAAKPELTLPGMIARYEFDEAKPGKHKNAVDGKMSASTSGLNKTVEGQAGKALELTGDDAVKLPVGNFRRSQPFSVALWLWTPDLKERAVVFHRSRAWTDAASRGYQLLLEDGKVSASLIHFWPGNAIRVRAKEPVPLKTWTHVVMAYDGSSRADGLTLFVNGQPIDSEVVRDHLTKEITGGGGNNIQIGERFRDKGFKQGRVDGFAVFNRELTELEARHLMDGKSLSADASKEALLATYRTAVSKPVSDQRETVRKAREAWHNLLNKQQEIMVMKERPEPRPAYILKRGHYEAHGEPVTAETPASLPAFPKDQPKNRLGLARWLTEPTHPLTARVTVNRYWQMHFGHGLTKTTEDFGSQGEKPSHPELLDWLAATFVESGWDLKALHRLILTSATYRQASVADRALHERDPDNRLLARGPRYRLPAEMVRDQALAVSGLLVNKIGGAPVKPYDLKASFKPANPDRGEGLYRRSVYTYWRRTGPSPLMMAFDAVKRNVCVVKRETTSSPLQALVLLNGPQFVEASRVLSETLMKEHGDNLEPLLRDAFERLTQREPDDAQGQVLKALYEEQLAYYQAKPNEAEALLKTGDRKPQAGLNPVQVAATTMLVSTLMNFDQSVMKR